MSEQGHNSSAPKGAAVDSSKENRLWSSVFIIIIGVSCAATIVGNGTNTSSSVYLVRLGEPATYAGILALLFSVAAGAARFVCGSVIDRYGRYAPLVVGAVVLLVGSIGPIFVPGLVMLAVWRSFLGFGYSMVATVSSTSAADVLPSKRLGEGVGYFGLGQSFAISVGAAFAFFLMDLGVENSLFWGMGLISAISVLLCLAVRYEKKPQMLPSSSSYYLRWAKGDVPLKADARKQDGTYRGLARFFEAKAIPGAVAIILYCGFTSFVIFFVGLYGTEIGISGVGYYFTIGAVAMIVIRVFSSRFMDRVPGFVLVVVSVSAGLACDVLLLVAGAFVHDPGMAAAAFFSSAVFYGMGYAIHSSVCQTVAIKNSPESRWGAASALVLLGVDIGCGGFGFLWGVVNDTFGFAASISSGLLLLIATLVSAWVLFPEREKHRRTASWKK